MLKYLLNSKRILHPKCLKCNIPKICSTSTFSYDSNSTNTNSTNSTNLVSRKFSNKLQKFSMSISSELKISQENFEDIFKKEGEKTLKTSLIRSLDIGQNYFKFVSPKRKKLLPHRMYYRMGFLHGKYEKYFRRWD